jgi:hypothetical protein
MPTITEIDKRAIIEGIIRDLDSKFPDYVVGLDFEFGDDWTGDPIIFIWIILTDLMAESDHFFETSLDFQDQLRQSIGAKFNEFVHIRFRSKSEQRKIKPQVAF